MSIKHFTDYIFHNGSHWNRVDLDNGLQLSIQGGMLNYCRPRQHGLRADQYTEWEVAVFKDGKMINPQCKSYEFSEGDNVFCYVPTLKVQELFEETNRLTKEEVERLGS